VKRIISRSHRHTPHVADYWEFYLLRCSIVIATALIVATDRALSSPPQALVKSVVNQYCIRCHDGDMKKGGLDLELVSNNDIAGHSAEWERVIRKLRTRQMPPIGKDRPPDETYDEVVAKLASSLDRAAGKKSEPGMCGNF
jgi:hypothetical protein